MITLVSVQAEEKERLHNIHQKYLYEMTLFYPDEMDGNGPKSQPHRNLVSSKDDSL